MSVEQDRARYAALIALRESTDLISDAELDEIEALETKYEDFFPGDVWSPPTAVPPLPAAAVPPLPAAALLTDPASPAGQTALIPRDSVAFTDEQLDLIAAAQKCTRVNLKKRWIILYDQKFYILGREGEYRAPPIPKSNLAASLPRDLARVPTVPVGVAPPDGRICWEKRAGETPIPKTVDDMIRDYCTVARNCVASMSIPHSYYDPKTETFWERVAVLRPIVPRFIPEIDQWVTYLGGDKSEKLKDWMAVTAYLAKPVCALYLDGPKDVGKSMFANGLSRLWSETGPTEMDSIVGSFNSAMTENPLVFADETLPENMTSGFLRRFIAQGAHPLKRKGLPEAKLLGCFRVIIAANNQDLLKFDKEDFSSEDVGAIADRILQIRVDGRAAEFLSSIGGRSGTEQWVDGDMIAAYALWLRDNRVVVPGKRFLVSGETSLVHRKIATGGGFRGLVVEWIAKAVLRRHWTQYGRHPGIVMGGGRLYVNASFVKDTWKDVLDDDRPPSLKRIGQALKGLTVPDPKTGKHERRFPLGEGRADFHCLDPQHVYDAAIDLQVGTVESFRALIEAKRAYVDDVPLEPPSPPGSTSLFDTVGRRSDIEKIKK